MLSDLPPQSLKRLLEHQHTLLTEIDEFEYKIRTAESQLRFDKAQLGFRQENLKSCNIGLAQAISEMLVTE